MHVGMDLFPFPIQRYVLLYCRSEGEKKIKEAIFARVLKNNEKKKDKDKEAEESKFKQNF